MLDHLRGSPELHLFEACDDFSRLRLGGFAALLGMDRLEHARNLSHLAIRRVAEDVSVEMDSATLPLTLRKNLADGFYESSAGVRDDQLDSFEASILQVAQKASPALQVLFLALGNTQDLPETIGS